VWNGAGGGSFASLSEEDCPLQPVPRRSCFRLTLPQGIAAGTLYLEVGGFRTRGFFAARADPVDSLPPRVVAASVEPGAEVAAREVVVLEFSETLDGSSRVEVSSAGAELAVLQRVVHRQAGFSEIRITPPAGGWPAGVTVIVSATAVGVRDLSGLGLDQDAATAAPEAFTIEFRGAAAP
jgi:hypothetical protein